MSAPSILGQGGGSVLAHLAQTEVRLTDLLTRFRDVLFAIPGLIATGLVYLWYRSRIQRESPGPTFFAQERIGEDGKPFVLYKFRTMYPDSETHLDALREKNEMKGQIFKIADDPRVTPTGRILRKYHLDELPQFYNVLRGEMTLIGTRPPLPSEVAQYEPHHFRRLRGKPGVTGLWQIEGNGKIQDFEEVVRLDCQYLDDPSLFLDFQILARTVAKVTRGQGC